MPKVKIKRYEIPSEKTRNINCVRKTTIHQKNKNGNFLFMSPLRVSRHLICER